MLPVAANDGQEDRGVGASCWDSEVLDEGELAKDEEAEEEGAVEDTEEGGAEEDDPVGEGGADGTASLDDVAGCLVDRDCGGKGTGIGRDEELVDGAGDFGDEVGLVGLASVSLEKARVVHRGLANDAVAIGAGLVGSVGGEELGLSIEGCGSGGKIPKFKGNPKLHAK